MNEIKLNPWKALGTLPFQADFSKHMQEGALLPNLTDWFDASVPGCIYQDLQNAGYIEDPYFGENSLHCEWVANRWWIYRTTFTVSEEDLRDTLKLTFHGIDYSAQIFLNGHKLGHHEGMYLPFEAIVNDYVLPGEENILVCIVEHAPFADPQPGYTSKTRYLKARYNYKWDFAVRLVSLGLYDRVTLERHSIASIAHRFVHPVKTADGWQLEIELELDAYRDGTAQIAYRMEVPKGSDAANASALIGTAELILQKGFNRWKTVVPVDDPALWWPNGYGAQALYDFQLTLTDEGGISDEFEQKVGFRTIEYRCADGREDALPYNVVINGKRIYLKGTNIVPFDCMTGTVTPERLRGYLTAVKEANVNYLRIWGGGHIESEEFYSLCDELGLMILQEFTMSSSGCDDVPSRNPEFLVLLQRAALHQVKLKRNHVSLTLWDGGNELTDIRYLDTEDHEGHPASFEDSTLAMLKGLTEALSPDIMMLPSSGSGPNALLRLGDTGNNHDVHGPWGYMGVEAHYTLYNGSDSIVHGEFGCGGMANYDAICRFTEEQDRRLCTSRDNRVWAHHSGGWDSYAMREQLLFGDLHDIPFEDYIKVSQYIQAESLRYSLEANRRRQWKNVGEMTWQFNEPWPNIQCSNVLDYYGGKKFAYHWIREAYDSVLTSLKYDRLFYQPGDDFGAELHIINDRPTAEAVITYTISGTDGRILAEGVERTAAEEDISQRVCTLRAQLPSDLTGGFTVKLHTECGEYCGDKEYLFLIADQEKPVQMTEVERKTLAMSKRPQLVNGMDDKRADPAVVTAFVDRYYRDYLNR